jgi:hypothetical protein
MGTTAGETRTRRTARVHAASGVHSTAAPAAAAEASSRCVVPNE